MSASSLREYICIFGVIKRRPPAATSVFSSDMYRDYKCYESTFQLKMSALAECAINILWRIKWSVT